MWDLCAVNMAGLIDPPARSGDDAPYESSATHPNSIAHNITINYKSPIYSLVDPVEPVGKHKLLAFLNLMVSTTLVALITVETHVAFILPPFIATAATKIPDPAWRLHRSIVVITSYLLSATVGVVFVLLHLDQGILMAVLASTLAYGIELILNIEHPPSVLATFLGILERASPTYILHPVLAGIAVIEGVNYLLSRAI